MLSRRERDLLKTTGKIALLLSNKSLQTDYLDDELKPYYGPFTWEENIQIINFIDDVRGYEMFQDICNRIRARKSTK